MGKTMYVLTIIDVERDEKWENRYYMDFLDALKYANSLIDDPKQYDFDIAEGFAQLSDKIYEITIEKANLEEHQ